jgi:hypothetical protein
LGIGSGELGFGFDFLRFNFNEAIRFLCSTRTMLSSMGPNSSISPVLAPGIPEIWIHQNRIQRFQRIRLTSHRTEQSEDQKQNRDQMDKEQKQNDQVD